MSADLKLNKNKGSIASHEIPKIERDNISSLGGFADRVRQFNDQSSTNNTNQDNDNSADDKSAGVSVEEYQNYKREGSKAFYERTGPRRSLSYTKNPQNPSWHNNSSECASSIN